MLARVEIIPVTPFSPVLKSVLTMVKGAYPIIGSYLLDLTGTVRRFVKTYGLSSAVVP